MRCKKHRAVLKCVDLKLQEYKIVCKKCGKQAVADDPWYGTLTFK